MDKPRYETCKLGFEVVERRKLCTSTWRWIATAMGPNGRYRAAQSGLFRAHGLDTPNDAGRAVLDPLRDQLVSKLLKSGWEPMDTRYLDQSFRRVVEDSPSEPSAVAEASGRAAEGLQIQDLLNKLKDLKEAGILTESEFADKVTKVLSMSQDGSK